MAKPTVNSPTKGDDLDGHRLSLSTTAKAATSSASPFLAIIIVILPMFRYV